MGRALRESVRSRGKGEGRRGVWAGCLTIRDRVTPSNVCSKQKRSPAVLLPTKRLVPEQITALSNHFSVLG